MPKNLIEMWVPWIGLSLDFITAALVIRKRLWRQLPAFSWYLLFGVVSGVIFAIVKLRYRSFYFYFYFAKDITYKMLNIWVTFEIYSRLMISFPALRQFAWRVLWTAGVVLLATCALVYKLTSFQGVSTQMVVLFTLGRSFRVVQLGLLSVIFLMMRSFQLQLRRYYTFVAIGLVMIDAGEFIALSLYLSNYRSLFSMVDHIRMIISIAVMALWIVVLYIGEGDIAAKAPPDYAALPLAEIEQWNLALSEARRK